MRFCIPMTFVLLAAACGEDPAVKFERDSEGPPPGRRGTPPFPKKHSLIGAAFSPNGRYVATAETHFVTLWDTRMDQWAIRKDPSLGERGLWSVDVPAVTVQFTSDGRNLVVLGTWVDNTLRILD